MVSYQDACPFQKPTRETDRNIQALCGRGESGRWIRHVLV